MATFLVQYDVVTSAKEIMFSLMLVCLLIRRIMKNSLTDFYKDSVDRWHMGHRKKSLDLVVIQIKLQKL